MVREGDGQGVFVVLEGIDGAGTTTQSERLARTLRAEGRLVHVTREPSTGPIGSMIRLVLTHRLGLPSAKHAETMALLFAADRLDHVGSEIEPLLQQGYVVISDRYDLSSLTYQSATVVERDAKETVAWIRSLNAHARRPDVTVVLDVAADVAAERRRARGGTAELFEAAELQGRLAGAYLRAESFVVGDRVIHVEGDRDPEAVARAVADAVAPFVAARSLGLG